jgi:hypothetical protein
MLAAARLHYLRHPNNKLTCSRLDGIVVTRHRTFGSAERMSEPGNRGRSDEEVRQLVRSVTSSITRAAEELSWCEHGRPEDGQPARNRSPGCVTRAWLMLRWPDFGRTPPRNEGEQRQPVSAVLAGQPSSAQVAGTSGTIYGSESWGFESLRARPAHRPLTAPGRGPFLLVGAMLRATAAGSGPSSTPKACPRSKGASRVHLTTRADRKPRQAGRRIRASWRGRRRSESPGLLGRAAARRTLRRSVQAQMAW